MIYMNHAQAERADRPANQIVVHENALARSVAPPSGKYQMPLLASSHSCNTNLDTGRPGVTEAEGARLSIPEVEVLDQDGRRVRFYTDLFQGRVVVVNVFFTSCTLVCPIQ
ncbi:MAG: hypothetical protein ABW208_04590, partial [Pyrinomonadaceae bacterium]